MYMAILAILAFVLCLHADTVVLITGSTVEGEIISKSDVILKIFSKEFNRAIVIEADKINYIVYNGQQVSFDEFQLRGSVYNTRFKVTPGEIKNAAAVRKKLFTQDVFEQARLDNADSARDVRDQNLFFNAPARWGSVGFGYFFGTHIRPASISSLGTYGFSYAGEPFDMRCIALQMRRNLRKQVGTLVIEFVYGREIFSRNDSTLAVDELAIMHALSAKYVFCKNNWLLSPGIYAGLALSQSSLIKYGGEGERNFEVPLLGKSILPLVGLDLNFYDVVSCSAGFDLFDLSRTYIAILFLMPFLQ